MKQTLLPVLLCHFFLAPSFAQSPTFTWVKTITFANANSGAEVFDFCTDPAGNSYVYGIFGGSINFGNGTFLQTLNALEGYFVAKYDSNGELKWVRKIVAPNGGAIYPDFNPGGISADAEGNVYLSGQLSNVALDFSGGVVLQRNCVGTPMCSDLFVAKYDASGGVQWVRQAAGSAGTFQKATRLVTGTDGTVFVAGNYEGQQINFDNTLTYNNLNTDGMYLAHYSPEGVAISASFFANGNSYGQVEHLAITPQNKVLVTGYHVDEALHFGNGLSLEPFGGSGNSNYFIVQYNAQGDAEWAHNLHSDSYLDLLDVAADTAGQPYLIVDFTTNLLSGTELVLDAVGGNPTGVVLHLVDSVFNPVVAVPYAGEAYPLANIAVDRYNRFFASGYFSKDNVQLAVANHVFENQGCDDALLLSGSPDTLPLAWARSAGGIGCEGILSAYYGRAVATDQAGNVYTVGGFKDFMQLDNFNKVGNGLFVAKLNTNIVGTNDPAQATLPFRLSPNPSNGDFSIGVDDLSGPTQVTVYDAQGGIRYRRSVRQAADLDFHLSLPNGMYTVVLVENNRIGRQKLLIIN